MSASEEAQRLKASRVEEAAELLRSGKRVDRVRAELRNRYDLSARSIEEYVKAAIKQLGPEFARSLNVLRYMDENELRAAAALAMRSAARAAKVSDFVGCAMNLRAYASVKQIHHRLWHLDKHSPLLGLEERDKRALIIEAVRDGAHLLTEEQRRELRDALSEIGDEDETVTTTMEAR